MAELMTVYTRIPAELKARVDAYVAQTPERQMTHALAELIRKGLDYDQKWNDDQQLRNERNEVRRLIESIDQWAKLLVQQSELVGGDVPRNSMTVLAQQIQMLRRVAGETDPVI